MKTLILNTLILIGSFSINAQSFELGQTIAGGFPLSVIFSDLDADNDIDLIRTKEGNSGASTLNASEIWTNNGKGTFTLSQSLGDTPGREVAVGDLDSDGDLDLFIAHGTLFGDLSMNYDKVWFNDGSGFFTNSGQLLDSRVSTSVVLADFDNDGDLDAFVGNEGDSNSECTVWKNDGNGQFTDTGQLLGINNSNTLALAICDVDNDLDIDVIAANCCVMPENTSRIWVNDGTGTFTMGTQNIGSFSSNDIAVADMNGDSHKDIILANLAEQTRMYLGDGNGNFVFDSFVHTNLDSRVALTFDYDLDGDLDLLLGEWGVNESVLLSNDGLGNFTEVVTFPDLNPLHIAQGDVDNDLDIDLFVANVNNEENRFWLNSKNSFQTQNISICQMDSIFLDGNWIDSAGIYYDTLVNAWGGDSIVETILSFETLDTSLTVINQTLIANATSVQYQWFDCDNQTPIVNQVSQSFTPTENGNFAVEITQNGCVDSSFCYSITTINGLENSQSSDNNFVIYPNPSDGNFSIKLGDKMNSVTLTITNINGQQIFSRQYKEQDSIQLELDCALGVYLLQIETEHKCEIISLFKYN